jgi:hypothetical protein
MPPSQSRTSTSSVTRSPASTDSRRLARRAVVGRSGEDTLDGGGGRDMLIGGNGNDTFFISVSNEIVTEAAGAAAGTADIAFAAVSYVLVANVEDLTLTGAAKINGTGNAGDGGRGPLLQEAGNSRLSSAAQAGIVTLRDRRRVRGFASHSSHAADVAARHCSSASWRKRRNVRREIRWRWRLKVL